MNFDRVGKQEWRAIMCNGNAIFLSRGESLSKRGEGGGFGHRGGHVRSLYYQLIHCSQISIIKRPRICSMRIIRVRDARGSSGPVRIRREMRQFSI